MKTLFATSVLLATVLAAAAEAAVTAPAVGSRASHSRSYNAGRTANGYMSNRSNNTTLNTLYNDGSVGTSMGRAINGVPSFNVVGSMTPSMNGSVYGTAASSFNNPFGSESSNGTFSTSFNGNGLLNQAVNPFALSNTTPTTPYTSVPYSAGFVSPRAGLHT